MGKTLRRNSLMKLDMKQKKTKIPHTFWRVKWYNPLPSCPKHYSRGSEWVYNDRQVALRDIAHYSQYYGTIEGPMPYVYRRPRNYRNQRLTNESQQRTTRQRSEPSYFDE